MFLFEENKKLKYNLISDPRINDAVADVEGFFMVGYNWIKENSNLTPEESTEQLCDRIEFYVDEYVEKGLSNKQLEEIFKEVEDFYREKKDDSFLNLICIDDEPYDSLHY
jgi:hypothetical protein